MSPRSQASVGSTSYLAVALVVAVAAVATIGVLELVPASTPGISATTSASSIAAGASSSTQNITAVTSPIRDNFNDNHLPDYCGNAIFPVLGQQENGSIFFKILTDQGSLVTNGSVLVTHSVSGNRTTYCLRLEPSVTGFVELANDGLPQAGVYNLTFAAGYDQGPVIQASVYLFSAQPNTSIHVIVSIPSGIAQMVTSTTGVSTVTTVTTTAPIGPKSDLTP
ncbi:MAG: hypothetical protein OK442_03935 [Thaumarchaeota archaeon]|nr:hypothetical protein [Nitrososphaerota archaeon]